MFQTSSGHSSFAFFGDSGRSIPLVSRLFLAPSTLEIAYLAAFCKRVLITYLSWSLFK
jgi:hypothetical protein